MLFRLFPYWLAGCLVCVHGSASAQPVDGYLGAWYEHGKEWTSGNKYSGGLGTYTAKHRPIAIYSAATEKTFFTYGGLQTPGSSRLATMVGAYDHGRKTFLPPQTVHVKEPGTFDPHENASISLDDKGHVWVFASGRMSIRPGFIFRSDEPHSIQKFSLVAQRPDFAYPQPWWVDRGGFFVFHTQYKPSRNIYWTTSADGMKWSEPQQLTSGGHYQVSVTRDERIGTALNFHGSRNPDSRTNLYYLYTDDQGKTWREADGSRIVIPVAGREHASLIHDYRSERTLVFLKDIRFDDQGQPVILYITSTRQRPGPTRRHWKIARFDGKRWIRSKVTSAFHNYDMGTMDVATKTWSLVAPTNPGKERWGAGGDLVVWHSTDRGLNWQPVRELMSDSERQHNYVRRPWRAHPDFGWLWADGRSDAISESTLYKSNAKATVVEALPRSGLLLQATKKATTARQPSP